MTPADAAERLRTELGHDAMALTGARTEEARQAVDLAGLSYWQEVAWELSRLRPPLGDADHAQGVCRLWWFMQRIEYCRHRAMQAEQRAAGAASDVIAREMNDMAVQWRDLALQAELLARAGGE